MAQFKRDPRLVSAVNVEFSSNVKDNMSKTACQIEGASTALERELEIQEPLKKFKECCVTSIAEKCFYILGILKMTMHCKIC